MKPPAQRLRARTPGSTIVEIRIHSPMARNSAEKTSRRPGVRHSALTHSGRCSSAERSSASGVGGFGSVEWSGHGDRSLRAARRRRRRCPSVSPRAMYAVYPQRRGGRGRAPAATSSAAAARLVRKAPPRSVPERLGGACSDPNPARQGKASGGADIAPELFRRRGARRRCAKRPSRRGGRRRCATTRGGLSGIGSTTPLPGARIVVVDDRPDNVMVLEHLLAGWQHPNVFGTTASTQAMGLVERVDPDLVLLDLQMPAPDGYEVMRRLESRIRGVDRLPVIVLTADISAEAKRQALSLGARDFLTKPFDADEVRMRVDNLLELRQAHLQLRDQNLTLEHRVLARTIELERARGETLERLSLAAEFRDDDTKQHAASVGRTVALLAEQFCLDDDEVARLRCAAPLHDIGKIGVPDSILLKSGGLTPDEYELMKT